MSDDNIYTDIHLVFESCRNAYTRLAESIKTFLNRFVSYRIKCSNDTDIFAYWACLGVEAREIETFVFVDPRWKNGRLWVNQSLYFTSDHGMAVLSKLML